ncbi:MAG: hypothetical protein K0R10_2941 [Alphaproteobacteria bacterium]|jgi:hypothetical protein|nr:hypothetical protein [Alphaproteobacteria bacterium]
MSLTSQFNSSYQPSMVSPGVLRVASDDYYYSYDFNARILIVRSNYTREAGPSVTPFSQLDRDSLIAARDKLVELGGRPPELPAEPNSLPGKPARLNP